MLMALCATLGKGTGRRADYHLGVILALAKGAPATRARKVHHRFAADIQNGRVDQCRGLNSAPKKSSVPRWP
jgi:hypothetical protein